MYRITKFSGQKDAFTLDVAEALAADAVAAAGANRGTFGRSIRPTRFGRIRLVNLWPML
jgi:hypothetical protein